MPSHVPGTFKATFGRQTWLRSARNDLFTYLLVIVFSLQEDPEELVGEVGKRGRRRRGGRGEKRSGEGKSEERGA